MNSPALVALRDAVTEGRATRTQIEEMATAAFGSDGLGYQSCAAYAANDMNAALALFGALLPGWIWGRQVNGAMFVARRPHTFRVTTGPYVTPARALLLATIEAKIQEAKE